MSQPELVVFIHSTGTGPAMWQPLLGTVPEGWATLTPANLGYGPASTWQPPAGRPFTLDDEVAHLLPQIPSDQGPVHLVAHSYGAAIALLLAQALTQTAKPGVASLWLYEPTPFAALRALPQADLPADVQAQLHQLYGPGSVLTDEAHAGQDSWLSAFIDYWNGAGTWQAVPERVRAGARSLGHKMFHEVQALSSHAPGFDGLRVPAPVTLVHGEHTQPPARQMAQQLAAVQERGRVEPLTGLGHMGIMGAPAPVRQSLRAHWQRLGRV